MTRQVIIGAGEVGTALGLVLPSAHVRDIESNGGPDTAEILHIAIPWSTDFDRIVSDYEEAYSADMVIVHSTVPVGTCDPRGWIHSPVRGRHPKLVEGLQIFPKHFGGARAYDASKFWPRDFEALTHDTAAITEAGKLWELVQFGIQVAVEKEIHAWCTERGLSPVEVYGSFASSYNFGFASLALHTPGYNFGFASLALHTPGNTWPIEPEFVRPILEHMPGPIGGHCVLPACEMINHPLGHWVIEQSAVAEVADSEEAADRIASSVRAASHAARKRSGR